MQTTQPVATAPTLRGCLAHSRSKRPAARKPAKVADAWPYPDLPESPTNGGPSHAIFWLHAWMRDVAELEAFKAAIDTKPMWAKRHKSHVTSMALTCAESALRQNARDALKHVIESGALLYAWHGTTVVKVAA